MDFSKLSNEDLLALKSGDYSKLSNEGLLHLKGGGQPQPVSQLESGVRGAAQGATAGFSDEITGGGEAMLNKLMGSHESLIDLYRQHRDEAREKNKAAQDSNPGTYLAGNLTGGVASTIATGGLGAGVKGAAMLGGAAGLGGSDADLTRGEVGQAAIDTGIGAGTGAVIGGVTKGLSALRNQGGKMAENLADSTFNTTGAGRDLLESGAVNPFQSSASKLQKIDEAITPLGKQKKAILGADKTQYDLNSISQKVRDRLGLPATDNIAASQQKVLNEVDSAAQRANGRPVTAEKLDQIQHAMGDQAKFNKQTFANPGDEFASKGFRDAYGVMGEEVGNVNKAIPPLNQRMSGLINAQDSVGNRNLNPVNMFSKTGVAKAAFRNGSAIGAITADSVHKMLQYSPQSLGRFADVLGKAANRSPESLKATLHVLQMSDPEFRQQFGNEQE